jgi:hypothetical protein
MMVMRRFRHVGFSMMVSCVVVSGCGVGVGVGGSWCWVGFALRLA